MTRNLIPSGVKWIGDVPSHWRVLEPRRIFSLRREAEHLNDVHLTPSQKHGVLPQAEYMKITGNRVVLNLSGNKMQHVEAGDFISHLRTFQGGLELAHQSGKVSPAYTVVAPRDGVTTSYFKYVFKSQGYISQIASITDQLRDGQSMRYPEFNQTWLPLPPPVEQRQIADYLDHETAEIDAFIDDLNRLAHLSNERMRKATDESLSSAALLEETAATILGRIIDINEGQIDPRLNQYREMPLIAPNHIESRTSRILEFESAYEQGAESGKYFAHKGQVLYSKIRPALMKASIAPVDCLCSADMYAIWGRSPWISNDFLLEYLLSPQFESYAVTMSDRVAMPKLNRETLNAAPVTLPSLAGQRRIVEINRENRRKSSALIFDVTEFIDLARERRAALITAAVTGQIDVTAKNKPAAEQLEDDISQGLHKES